MAEVLNPGWVLFALIDLDKILFKQSFVFIFSVLLIGFMDFKILFFASSTEIGLFSFPVT